MADKTENKPGFVARAKAAVKNFFGKCAKFFRDTKSELKKVVWPSKEDVKTNTVVVLVTVAIAEMCIRDSYKALETESVRCMTGLLPDELSEELSPFISGELLTAEEKRLLKAARCV